MELLDAGESPLLFDSVLPSRSRAITAHPVPSTPMVRSCFLPLLLLLLLPHLASAQASVQLREGDRLRLTSDGASGVFEFQSLRSDTLFVRREATQEHHAISLSEVTGASVDRGSRSPGAGALRGAGAGALIGGLVGVVIGFLDGDDECYEWCFVAFEAHEKAMIAGISLGGVGALAGGVLGAISPGQRWERVDLPVPNPGK